MVSVVIETILFFIFLLKKRKYNIYLYLTGFDKLIQTYLFEFSKFKHTLIPHTILLIQKSDSSNNSSMSN